jgi:Fe2+ or Zn2+ uptake regulation protein
MSICDASKACNHSRSFRERSKELLKVSGGRITGPRLLVIKCLDEADVPLSAQDIFERIESVSSKEEERVDKVTVYRILEKLTELNLVHRVGSQQKYMACHHVHEKGELCKEGGLHVLIQCSNCGITEEIGLTPELGELVAVKVCQSGFSSLGVSLQGVGRCNSCAL